MKLGSLELGSFLLAPLSGVSDSPFRRMCKRFGADAVYSEMVSSEGLSRGSPKTMELMRFDDGERPIGIQIFGRDPRRMAAAAGVVQAHGADFVDLNLACPARKIVSRGVGCALLREPATVGKIAQAVVGATSLPVTAKTRIGWDDDSLNAVEIARILEDAGVAAVCVHGRTYRQGFAGESSWSEVAAVKRSLSIPVILSGDVTDPQSAGRAFEATGCDAVMVGRAAFGRPWIFAAMHAYAGGREYECPEIDRIVEVILEHLDLSIRLYGERLAAVRFRKHLLWYTKGIAGVVALRPVMSTISSRRDAVEVVSRLAGTAATPGGEQ